MRESILNTHVDIVGIAKEYKAYIEQLEQEIERFRKGYNDAGRCLADKREAEKKYNDLIERLTNIVEERYPLEEVEDRLIGLLEELNPKEGE